MNDDERGSTGGSAATNTGNSITEHSAASVPRLVNQFPCD
jgi:hypothetical protein